MYKNNFNKNSQLRVTLSSEQVQSLLMARAKTAVLETAVNLMEEDIRRLCGEPFARKSDSRLCHRGGSEMTSIFVDGAKQSVRKPRARKNGKEVDLPSLVAMQDRDLLDEQMLLRILKGVSTRNYEEVINGFSEKTGISKSSVSRAFKRASKKDLEAINDSDLSQHRFISLLIDGTHMGEWTQIVAIGITTKNEKIPIGLVQGDTENANVVKDLLSSLVARGFTFGAKKILAVLDGGKALRAAVKALWGELVLIQRCWLHKLRNIQDYIPKQYHSQLWRRMKKMMGLNEFLYAKKEFESLKSWLHEISVDAVKSLVEAGMELLTVHSLNLTGDYKKSFTTTNIIESLMGVIKTKSRQVKNWKCHPKTGSKVERDKALRWTATAIQSHKTKMRKLKGGSQQVHSLIAKLNNIDTINKAS
jgi:putative transposase